MEKVGGLDLLDFPLIPLPLVAAVEVDGPLEEEDSHPKELATLVTLDWEKLLEGSSDVVVTEDLEEDECWLHLQKGEHQEVNIRCVVPLDIPSENVDGCHLRVKHVSVQQHEEEESEADAPLLTTSFVRFKEDAGKKDKDLGNHVKKIDTKQADVKRIGAKRILKSRIPTLCPICQRVFTREANFKRHFQTVHNPQRQVTLVEGYLEEEEFHEKEMSPLTTLQGKELVEETPLQPNEDSCGFHEQMEHTVARQQQQHEDSDSVLLTNEENIEEFNDVGQVLKCEVVWREDKDLTVEEAAADVTRDDLTATPKNRTTFCLAVKQEETQLVTIFPRTVAELSDDVVMKNKELDAKRQDVDATVDVKRESKKVLKKMESRLACPACQMTFTRPESVKRHIRTAHNPQRPIPARGIHPRRHRCSQCEASFSAKEDFDRHTRKRHNPQRRQQPKTPTCEDFSGGRYKCSQCDATFSQKGSLPRHVHNIHDKLKSTRSKRKPKISSAVVAMTSDDPI